MPSIFSNPTTSYNSDSLYPKIHETSFIHHFACVIGNILLDEHVFVAPFACIRGDEGTPIYIGKNSNVQDGVVIHGLKDQFYEYNGEQYSVYVGAHTSLSHQCQVHGPAIVGNNVFIGMQSLVFKSIIEDNSVIEPGAKIVGVRIPANRYVTACQAVTTQEEADNLPEICPNYMYRNLNDKVIDVNIELAKSYPEMQITLHHSYGK